MTIKEWKEYALSWCLATLSDYGLAARIKRARTWSQLEDAIPWQLTAALANRCKNSDLWVTT